MMSSMRLVGISLTTGMGALLGDEPERRIKRKSVRRCERN